MTDLKTLDEIAIANQTDMATVFTRTYAKPHGYTVELEKFFEPIRFSPIKLLEIGVGGGESIRTWLDYFPKAKVFGVDNVKDTNQWNTPGFPHERYKFNCANQEDGVFWKCFLADHGKDWDVIVDDGGHEAIQIETTFVCMWPFVRPGGFYCVEDLAYSWAGNRRWISDLLDAMNRDGNAKSLHFSKELLVLTKR